MKLISREEAITKGVRRYFTGKPCSKGHIAEQLVYDKRCYKCLTMRNTLWLKKQNAEKRKKLHRERYHKDIANLKKHYGLLDTSDESIKKARAKRNGGKKFKNALVAPDSAPPSSNAFKNLFALLTVLALDFSVVCNSDIL